MQYRPMSVSGQSLTPSIQTHLIDIIRNVYVPAGKNLTHPVQVEPESAEYGACRFSLDMHAVAFRIAKTTPTKTGQFVTIWKRTKPGGEIAPLDTTDDVQFLVISVADGPDWGHFIFNRKILMSKGVMSCNGKGGKRAIRVYPPWNTPKTKDAIRAQKWQLQHFLPVSESGTVEYFELVRKLFQLEPDAPSYR